MWFVEYLGSGEKVAGLHVGMMRKKLHAIFITTYLIEKNLHVDVPVRTYKSIWHGVIYGDIGIASMLEI